MLEPILLAETICRLDVDNESRSVASSDEEVRGVPVVHLTLRPQQPERVGADRDCVTPKVDRHQGSHLEPRLKADMAL